MDFFVSSNWSNDRLNSVRVDDLSDIRVGDDGSVKSVSVLFIGDLSEGTEDFVKGGESGLGPDDESSEVTTWGELFKVKSVDVGNIDSGDVSDSSDEVDVFVSVDDQGTSSNSGSLVSQFADSGSEGSGFSDSVNIIDGTDLLEESKGVLGLFNSFDFIINNQGNLGKVGDLVSSSFNQRSDTSGSESSGNGVSLLSKVNLSVPSSPGLQGSEHSTLSTHVTEGTLA